MSFEHGKAGINLIPAYQLSGVPYSTGSGTTTEHLNAAGGKKFTFPQVSRFVTLSTLTPEQKLYVAFAEEGHVGTTGVLGKKNFFTVGPESSATLDVRCTAVYIKSSGATQWSMTVGLTPILSGGFPELSGSTGFHAVGGLPTGVSHEPGVVADVAALAGTATRWVAGANNRLLGYAADIDRTSWTFYNRLNLSYPPGNAKALDIAYGKDNSGNPIYVVANTSQTKDVSVSSTNVTDGNPWTHVNLSQPQYNYIVGVAWSNNVWLAVGEQIKMFRSTDGASSWTEIDTSGFTSIDDNIPFEGIAGDGTGNWLVSQKKNIYSSTNNGATWSRAKQLVADRHVRGLAFTNGCWVAAYDDGSPRTTRLIACNPADLSTWSAFQSATALPGPEEDSRSELFSRGTQRTKIAANSSGRIVVLPWGARKIGYADVALDGGGNPTVTTLTVVDLSSLMPASEVLYDVATDGATWLAVGSDGVVLQSRDDGVNWTLIASDIFDSTLDMMAVTPNVYIPL